MKFLGNSIQICSYDQIKQHYFITFFNITYKLHNKYAIRLKIPKITKLYVFMSTKSNQD